MSMGIWYEAILRWVGEAANVTARASYGVEERRAAESDEMVKIAIPEYLSVSATLAGGVPLTMLITTVGGAVAMNEVRIFGTEGTLVFRDGALLGARRGGELGPVAIPADEVAGWRVEEEFVNAIRGLEPVVLTPLAEAIKYMEFTQAVADSL